jgi:hypothetical protein
VVQLVRAIERESLKVKTPYGCVLSSGLGGVDVRSLMMIK